MSPLQNHINEIWNLCWFIIFFFDSHVWSCSNYDLGSCCSRCSFLQHLCCRVSAIENGDSEPVEAESSGTARCNVSHLERRSPRSKSSLTAPRICRIAHGLGQFVNKWAYHCANAGPGFTKDQSVKNPFVIARRCKSACSSSELSSAAPRFKDSLHTTGLIRTLPTGSSMHLTFFDARLENLYNSRPSREEDRNMFYKTTWHVLA